MNSFFTPTVPHNEEPSTNIPAVLHKNSTVMIHQFYKIFYEHAEILQRAEKYSNNGSADKFQIVTIFETEKRFCKINSKTVQSFKLINGESIYSLNILQVTEVKDQMQSLIQLLF
jgi:hypothetical protein